MSAFSPVYLVGLLTGFAGAAFSLPWWRRWCDRIGLIDYPGGRKQHDAPVPLAGGLAILTGLLLSLALTGWAAGGWANMLGDRPPLVWGILLTGLMAMALLGWWDDRTELRPTTKLVGQLVVAVATAAAGIRITLFVPSLLFSFLVTVLWIVTVTNAFNLSDNMNGLCAGLGALASGWLAVHAAKRGDPAVAVAALVLCGATLGFLPYNFPRASAFLGDCGSHLIGYLVAVLTILPDFYSAAHPRPWAVLSPVLIVAVPLLDLVWVVWVRLRLRQPIYVGDTNHLSHQLVRRGLSPVRAVLVLWLAAAALGGASLWL